MTIASSPVAPEEGFKTAVRTAFVLAGGGSLGAIQAGMLTELMAAGVRPDLIVAVSAGAINGAFLAHDPCELTAEHIAELWCKVTTRQALGLSWRSLFGVLRGAGHFAHSRGLRGILERELPYRQIEAARVPLHIVAAEEATGSEILLDRGDLVEAVLASTAQKQAYANAPDGASTRSELRNQGKPIVA